MATNSLGEMNNWDWGHAVERFLREWAKRRGDWVLAVSEIATGGAPMLEGADGRIIAADSLFCRDGVTRFTEFKGKARATKNQQRGRWEHGIDAHQWEAYQKLCTVSGLKGNLMIWQADTRKIFEGSFEDIAVGAAFWAGDPSRRNLAYCQPMWYFDLRRFQDYDWDGDQLLPVNPPSARVPDNVRVWEQNQPLSRQLPLI